MRSVCWSRHGRRKSKHTDGQRNVCLAYWAAAQDNAEVRNSVNTRITYKSVFEHFRRGLEAVGVTTERQFRAILHSAQSRECENRRRAIEARREEARQKNQSSKQVKPARKNDIIPQMKKTAKTVLIMAAAVACGICAPSRSQADFVVWSLMPMPIVARVLFLPVVKERLFYAGREEAVLHYT